MTPAFIALLLVCHQLETEVSERAHNPVVRPLAADAASDEETLREVADVGLAQSGGPLTPARLEVRGLSGARTDARFAGLSFSDPASGDIDLGLLPLYLGAAGTRKGAALDVPGQRANTFGARARLAFGSLNTMRADLVATLAPPAGEVSLGATFARTAGDFVFTPRAPDGRLRDPQVRTNNDQTRAGLAALARGRWGVLEGRATVLGAFHEGGVPGFATFRTDGLRGRRALVGSVGQLSARLGPVTISSSGAARLSTRASFDDRGRTDTLRSLHAAGRTDASVSAGPTTWTAAAGAARTALLDGGFSRREAFVEGGAQLSAGPLFAGGRVRGALLSDVGALVGGEVLAHLRWGPAVLGVEAAHRPRAPTLDELFAPRGLVLGNPELLPEAVTDVSARLHVDIARTAFVEVAPFAGYIWDAILYTNRNAYEIAPVNTGPGFRAGVSGKIAARPHPWVTLRGTGRALASQVFAAGAPLPLAPPLQGRLRLGLGPAKGPRLVLAARGRSSTPSNLFGTLRTPGYTRYDAGVAFSPWPGVDVSVSAQNLLNKQDASDIYLFPLPGRLLFVGLSVAS